MTIFNILYNTINNEKYYIKSNLNNQKSINKIKNFENLNEEDKKYFLYFIKLTGNSQDNTNNLEVRIMPYLDLNKGYFLNVNNGNDLGLCIDLLTCKSSTLFEIQNLKNNE